MTVDELQRMPFGAVLWDPAENRYYRKGRWDTWHPIHQSTGERVGQQNAVRSAYMLHFHPQVTAATAETWRLSSRNAQRVMAGTRR